MSSQCLCSEDMQKHERPLERRVPAGTPSKVRNGTVKRKGCSRETPVRVRSRRQSDVFHTSDSNGVYLLSDDYIPDTVLCFRCFNSFSPL